MIDPPTDASAPALAWTADEDGLLDWAANWWLERTGTAEEGIQGGAWHRMLHPEDRETTYLAWNRAIETGEPYEMRHRIRLADGRWHVVISRGKARKTESGHVLGWVGTVEVDAEPWSGP